MKKISNVIGGIAAICGILAFLLFKNSKLGFDFILVMLIAQAISEFYEYRETKKKIHLMIPIFAIITGTVFLYIQIIS